MIIQVHTDKVIQLLQGYSEVEINTDRDIDLTFRASYDSEIFIRIRNAGKVTLHTYTDANIHVTYLFWNEMTEELNVVEDHEVLADSNLKIAYGEVNKGVLHRKTRVMLSQPGASATVSSATLVQSKKNYEMNVISFAPHTVGLMENYAVVLSGGNYTMNATGQIVKGAYGSESHQTSRALTFDEDQQSTILPKLLIDENDVQASHATTLGRVDEDQLYYMQTRGLTEKQCTSLISTGYLMPVANVISDENLKEKLRTELEGKLSEL